MSLDMIIQTVQNNVDTIGWHIVFLFLIPNFLGNKYLGDYINLLSLLAIIYSASGEKDGLFKNLYNRDYTNAVSLASTTLIDILTLSGIAATGIRCVTMTKNVNQSTLITAIAFLILYLLPIYIVPNVVQNGQNVGEMYNMNTVLKRNAVGVAIGFATIMFFVTLQNFLVTQIHH